MRADYRIKFIRKLCPPPGTILDIGCGSGDFLLTVKNNNYSGEGIELSNACAYSSCIRTGFNVHVGTLDDFTGGTADNSRDFDIITLWDVIEHLTDPMATLNKINTLQEKGGLLALSTVNLMNYRYFIYRKNWLGFTEGQEHTIFFSPRTLVLLLEKCGYAPVKIMTKKIPPYLLRWLNIFRLGHSLEVYAEKQRDATF